MTTSLFDSADLISVYSRQQAIEDGVLIDATELSAECGFTGKVPLAVTANLFSILRSDKAGMVVGADETARRNLRDVLRQAAGAVALRVHRRRQEREVLDAIDLEDVSFEYARWGEGGGVLVYDLHAWFNSAEGFTIGLPEDR